MITSDYHQHLPPYRSLLNPNAKYDYQLHSLIPVNANDYNYTKQTIKPFKMKYKSLLNDVNRKISIKSMKFFIKIDFRNLPIEIQYYVFSLLDMESLKNCLLVNKDFYKLSKKFLYRDLKFDSSFRLGQFITILRINSKLGKLVKTIDLSDLKPCNYDEENEESIEIKAGWRDWKFLKNPLYTNNLTRIQSHSPSHSPSQVSGEGHNGTTNKKRKFSFLKKRKKVIPPVVVNYHPTINKFLVNFSNTKDIPIGYLLHLINLCPNLTEINLSNVNLSTDYEINRNFHFKFLTFDCINNYPVESLNVLGEIDDSSSIYNVKLSEISDNYSIYSNNEPIWKYHSLLEPIPVKYNNDGKLYLSDINLKSINNKFLTRLKEADILKLIIKYHYNNGFFKYLDLSSMVWLNKDLVKKFLSNFLHFPLSSRNTVINLKNSGMIKDLAWAQLIDLSTSEGRKLAIDIINGEVISFEERLVLEDRERRGRMAENYL